MSVMDVLKRGADFTNADETAQGMMVDFKDHKVGMQLDADEVTQVVKDGVLSLEEGIREDCHVVLKMKTEDLCSAIDNTFDLMEIKDKGELVKGDMTDPNVPVHLMATFPFFDAMVRLYESDDAFKKQVDEVKSSL
ncbi:MAG: hypothetical protein R3339_02995 [Thermodesulfobacteriota bacterium]|jgi:hypothetical protein|nr:hypothetical protein [Thermodesulfobacteriota bacterium]